jgi:hypothetical protein
MNLKSDITSNIISTSIVGILSYLITNTTNNKCFITLLFMALFILGLIIINYRQPLKHMFKKTDWKIMRKWKSTWKCPKDGNQVIVEDEIILNQVGSYIYGKGISNKIEGDYPFSEARYTITGHVNNEGLFIGEWKSTKSKNYYGVFFLQCKRSGLKMAGHWIGVGSEAMRLGDWNWESDIGANRFDDDSKY